MIRPWESHTCKSSNAVFVLKAQMPAIKIRTTQPRHELSLQSSHIAAFALAASSSLRLCAAFSSSLRLRSFSRTALS